MPRMARIRELRVPYGALADRAAYSHIHVLSQIPVVRTHGPLRQATMSPGRGVFVRVRSMYRVGYLLGADCFGLPIRDEKWGHFFETFWYRTVLHFSHT